MSESKHTPGTWIVIQSEEDGKEFKVNTSKPRNSVYADAAPGCGGGAASNGNEWVCSIWTGKTGKRYAGGHCKRTLKDYQEAEANARLIAATPELLSCLKCCMDFISGLPQHFIVKQDKIRVIELSKEVLELSEAVIAKAEKE